MSWNYRIVTSTVKVEGFPKKVRYEIREVYYDDDLEPIDVAERPARVMGEDVKQIKWVLDKMIKALDKDVIEETEAELIKESRNTEEEPYEHQYRRNQELY